MPEKEQQQRSVAPLLTGSQLSATASAELAPVPVWFLAFLPSSSPQRRAWPEPLRVPPRALLLGLLWSRTALS
ncbi:hypothetical protein A4R35_19720 [Thermogemmatispora tikiterensis]|uniref:Uncharacterized protein n=1 Tax=Thermogemmatispora tikiterensis TaxID=1825093 RepID=A0A328VIK2_9CHLR|nr:hypothetical protein A4R35_19720 [Thermogemmatispora tikiterensis]